MARTKVILDTDIGDDIDDVLALALICSLPELDLRGVTTVYGNTVARGRQAQTLLQLAGEKFGAIPVAAGCGATLASRKNGVPNTDVLGQASTTWAGDRLPAMHQRHGVDVLIEELMAGDVIPITIGAMTNLAVAITMEPRLLKKIPRIMTMASEFKVPMAEWNIKCDPEAAHLCFASGIPMQVITWSIGRTAMMAQGDIQQMGASDRPMAKYLAATIEAWQRDFKHAHVLPSLYDPMAVAAIVKPELFEWEKGNVSVELQGQATYGYTQFAKGDGPHQVAMETDQKQAVGWYMRQIVGS